MSEKTLTEEVESELNRDVDDDPYGWSIAYKFIIIMFCCLFLIAGLKVNDVAGSPLFGISAFFGLCWLGRWK